MKRVLVVAEVQETLRDIHPDTLRARMEGEAINNGATIVLSKIYDIRDDDAPDLTPKS